MVQRPPSRPSASPSDWLVRRRPADAPRVRLFCFPYAGAGSLVYFKWADEVPDDVEVCAVQLPGRENRLREPARADLGELVGELADALTPYLDVDFAFFGHSFGSLVAFELTRELRRRGLPLPATLIVSGRRGPSCKLDFIPVSTIRDDDAFVQEIGRRYGGIPKQILAVPELVQLILPVLRADLAITESYAYRPEPPLGCRLVAFGGSEDGGVTEDMLAAWSEQAGGAFSTRIFPGGHFFLNDVRPQVVAAVSEVLSSIPERSP